VRGDLIIVELARGAGDGVVFFREIFGGEDVVRRLVLYKKGSAGRFG
jgi:hypothetical protein